MIRNWDSRHASLRQFSLTPGSNSPKVLLTPDIPLVVKNRVGNPKIAAFPV
jgi:hypothetical protein